MSGLLTLSRASHLLGVPRSTLQRMVRDGLLVSGDGLLTTAELLRAFPDTRLDDAGMLDAVTRIRDESFGRRVRERLLPSQEILAERIFRQSEELTDLRRHLQQYHGLVQSLLTQLEQTPAGPLRDELHARLEHGLAAILASETASGDDLEVMSTMLDVVSAHVTVRPSGREFVVEGRDTLLQAGLKAGLRLNYGCGSGSCGLCKTRVVSGEVRQTAPADYPLSAAEKDSGVVLGCVCTPLTDVVIETLEASGPADIPAQAIVAAVRAVTPLGADTRLVHVQTPRSARLRFLAGQSVTLGVSSPAGDISTTWPIASCPCDDRNLHFHVVRDADDPLAAAVFAGHLKSGTAINLRGPLGDFSLAMNTAEAGEAAAGQPLVFLACDTGFAPIKGLIEHAVAIDQVDTFGLAWIATRSDGHYLDNQCRMWAAAFDRFAYLPLTATDAAAGGRLAVDTARREFAFLAAAEVYIAGPTAFVAAVRRELETRVPAPARIVSTIV